MDDAHIADYLLSNDAGLRNKALTILYTDAEFKSQVSQFLRSKGSNHEEADDIFTNAIIATSLQIHKNKTLPHKGIKPYIFSICKYLWYNELKKRKVRKVSLQEFNLENGETPATFLFDKDTKQITTKLLERIGNPCQSVLKMWSYGYRMKEIAQKVGYSSESVARKKKYKCLKKLIDIIDSDAELKQYLRELK